MPPLKADAMDGFQLLLCPWRSPPGLRFVCGAEGNSCFVLLFSQDLSYNQLTECPRELENAKNMLVLNLGHNRWVLARVTLSPSWPWPLVLVTLCSGSCSLPLLEGEPGLVQILGNPEFPNIPAASTPSPTSSSST